MFLKNRKYKSEISKFITCLKIENPELENSQKSGRSILWDETDDSNKTKDNSSPNKIKQSPYVYF